MSFASYNPLQNGVGKQLSQSVDYSEYKLNKKLQNIVHCFWTLKSHTPLSESFIYTVMPDACIDIVFDITGTSKPIIMTPHLHIENINLGKSFHYVGIRFKPGVFKHTALDTRALVGQQQEIEELAGYSMTRLWIDMQNTRTDSKRYLLLEDLVRGLQATHTIERNTFIENVITDMQSGLSVEAISKKMSYSSRQLRRKVNEQTGFSPMQLQRVLRFQMALSSKDVSLRFADQSHLIKEFKNITGTSYREFIDSFK